MRGLGGSSYSLYLTHAPIVAIVCERIVGGRVPAGVPMFVVSLALVLPLTIGFAWAFAKVFETRFRQPRPTPAEPPRARPLPSGAHGVPA
jgi:peptidoglycan/LPS O-acetylase OafA/YrhL